MTRTYTRYFSDDNEHVQAIEQHLSALNDDLEQRAPYITDEAALGARNRLRNVQIAMDFLTERVAE